MKQKLTFIASYAILIFIGGIMGYLTVNSLASLITSIIFSLALLVCVTLMWKRYWMANHLAIIIISCLLIFFSYRFFLTYKMVPSGVMAIISGSLLIYLITTHKKNCSYKIS